MSWQRRILRVDLTAGTTRTEPLNMDWAQQYLGQRGLGTKYYAAEVDPRVDPLSPANKLIFATGPLTGTTASTGGRYSVITKGALTGAIACSNSGGRFGAELKFAGYDLLILEGRSERPVYLLIEDERSALLPAEELWGEGVWRTEEIIHTRHQDPRLRVAAVGPSAERGCLYACVVNDLHRAAGRSGVGTVMASKGLKAIAVRGTRGVPAHDPQAFLQATAQAKRALADNASRKELTRDGTIAMMDTANAFGTLPTRNNQAVQFEGADRLNPVAMQSPNAHGHVNLVTNSACFGCTIACGRLSRIDPAHFTVRERPQYAIASGGLEYETAYALGAAVGVDDLDAATYAGFLCNDYGMDPISLGGSIAAAMELYERGLITREHTGGLELRFGEAEALCRLTELVGRGEGFGREVGMGSRRLCEKYGRPELAMVVKGQEFAAYDGRSMQGMGLGYATSNRGACHLRADPYGHDFRTTEIEEKPRIVKDSQDEVAAIDSSGLCLFAFSAGWNMDSLADQIAAGCEGQWSAERLREVGERIWNLERQINLGAGLTAADDTLPKRILTEPAPSGTAKGLVSRLPEMLPVYYRLRGWDAEGRPTRQTLERLGLQ